MSDPRPSRLARLRADKAAHETAFAFAERQLDWGSLDRRAGAWAARLVELGLTPGDRIAVYAETSADLICALFGHLRGGFVHVPINTRYKAAEAAHILVDSGARALLVDASERHREVIAEVGAAAPELQIVLASEGAGGFEAHLAGAVGSEPPTPSDDDVAMLIYTSGTTGPSKGVMLTHAGLLDNIGALTREWGFTGADHMVLALPIFHVHGLGLGVLGTLIRSMRCTALPQFSPQGVVDAIAAGGTIFMGVPTMYARLLQHLEAHPEAARILGRARLFTSGSAALPAAHFERFRALTGHAILERYGMSETLFTLSNPGAGPRRPGTVGLPVPGCEVRVVAEDGTLVRPGSGEVGEIQVRSHGIMKAYWNRPDATAASFDGDWFSTGDVATLDADGYHRIVGRRSVDIIKSGGFKISAREIEDAIRDLDGVEDVAVVGIPDETWGERIVCAVVLEGRARGTLADPAALLDYVDEGVASRLADFKKPRAAVALEALPRNALGKVQKHRVKALFA